MAWAGDVRSSRPPVRFKVIGHGRLHPRICPQGHKGHYGQAAGNYGSTTPSESVLNYARRRESGVLTAWVLAQLAVPSRSELGGTALCQLFVSAAPAPAWPFTPAAIKNRPGSGSTSHPVDTRRFSRVRMTSTRLCATGSPSLRASATSRALITRPALASSTTTCRL